MKNSRLGALSLIFMAIILASTTAIFRARSVGPPWFGYVKPAYPDYAPSGVPDFDQSQDGWNPHGIYTWCGPVAVANSLWWLDSEYESLMFGNPVPPPTYSEHFPLVTNYTNGVDDHDPSEVFPLVPNLAFLMDTDGLQTQDGHIGTRWQDLESGIRNYTKQQGVEKYFEVHDSQFPTFEWIENETEWCQDVVLFLEFYQFSGGYWYPVTSIPSFEAGHYVTVAGVNSTTNELLISDPYWDNYEANLVPGRSPVSHIYPHGTGAHNNASLVSQDAYKVIQYQFPMPPPPPPPGYPLAVYELVGYLQTHIPDPTLHAFIRVAIATSPKEVPEWPGYIKPPYPDYAPAGMPDFDEKQDAWGPAQGIYTWCVPVAVANSLWWLDSKYESIMFPSPVPPPTISDHFPLVQSSNPLVWDDHDPNNIFNFVRNLALLMDTDGMMSGDGHVGTRWTDIPPGIRQYLVQQGVSGMFEVHSQEFPDLMWIENETEMCQDVELFLEFWQWTGTWEKITQPDFENGHCVTCAGVNSTASTLLISDPYFDAYEANWSGRSPFPHAYPHNSAVHNDAQYVSQDGYPLLPILFPPNPAPPGYPAMVWELGNYLTQNLGLPPSYHAFIRGAVATSPTAVHDVAVTNVTTDLFGCVPICTMARNWTTRVNVTVLNEGDFTENVTLTAYANTTVIGTKNVTLLAPKAQQTVSIIWNCTGFSYYSRYVINATATPVAGEGHLDDNSRVGDTVRIVITGDVDGDTRVTMGDINRALDAFGSTYGKPRYDPNCDIDPILADYRITMGDINVVLDNFGKQYKP